MDVIINELSIAGQYIDIPDFSEHGLAPMTEFLKMAYAHALNNKVTLLKKSDIFNLKVTPSILFYELLTSRESRLDDRIRKFKSYLAKLQTEPYWDINQYHNTDHDYIRSDNGFNDRVTSSGVAEAHARDGYLLSFVPSEYESPVVTVDCVQLESVKKIRNSSDIKIFYKELYLRGEIDIVEYMSARFHQKFNFSEIDQSHGLNLITNLNFDIFDSSFDSFESKTWQQIRTNDALDYKEFHKNRNTRQFFSEDKWKMGVWKFRIDQEKRCFGIRRGDIFYVWRIDLDHKLSDLG